MSHVFISYSRKNSDFVELLETDMEKNDHSVWRDVSDIPGGAEWAEEIEDALSEAYAVIAIVSQPALESKWVNHEIDASRKEDIPIVPALLEEVDLPSKLEDVQAVDFTQVCETEGFEQISHYGNALGKLVDAVDDARPVLRYMRQLQESQEDEVRERAAYRLAQIGDPIATDVLISALDDPDADVRFSAAEALGKLGSEAEAAVKPLIRLLDDEDPDVCAAAAFALGCIGRKEAINPLADHLTNRDRYVRICAVRALGNLRAQGQIPQFIDIMRNDHIGDVRDAAAAALRKIGGPEAKRALHRAGWIENEAVERPWRTPVSKL